MKLKKDLDKISKIINHYGGEFSKKEINSKKNMEISKDVSLGYSFDFYDGVNSGHQDGLRLYVGVMREIGEILSEMNEEEK